VANTWTKEAVSRAKAEGLTLVKLEINGRHAKRDSMSMSGPVGPKTAEKVRQLFMELCKLADRME
jgi:hypothetical protein